MSKKPKQKHGGKRPGAGRPYNYDEILIIGGECENLLRAEVKAKLDAAIEQRFKHADIEHEKANAILVEDREKWLKSEGFEIHKENLEYAMQSDEGSQTDEEGIHYAFRYVTVAVKRPKGVRKQILEIVKQIIFDRYGWDKSVSTINKYWKRYRAELKILDAETKDYVPKHNAQPSSMAHDPLDNIKWPDSKIDFTIKE